MAPWLGIGLDGGQAGDSDFDGVTGNCGWKCGGGDLEFWTRGRSSLSLVPLLAFLGAAKIPWREAALIWAPGWAGAFSEGLPRVDRAVSTSWDVKCSCARHPSVKKLTSSQGCVAHSGKGSPTALPSAPWWPHVFRNS